MDALSFRTVAFDLDGTLADTSPDITGALNKVLAAFGLPPIPLERVRRMIGDGAKALIGRALAATGACSDDLIERAYPLYLDFYAADICNGTVRYNGAEEALDSLAAAGASLALCTNKPERLTTLLVAALGWEGRFASVVAGDMLPTRKPDPLMLREAIARAGGGPAAFVGDTIVDAETARAAGVPFVAVRFGYSDRPAEALGADLVIGAFSELPAALDQLAARNAFTSR
jgi:phosphoglycolate phosphatase